MALPDLLWACPECGEDRGLEPDRPGYRCTGCETRFVRDRGASIRAERPDGTHEVAAPETWLERLPDPASLLERRRDGTDAPGGPVRAARVSRSHVTGARAVHGAHGYLNRIELWGDEVRGTLALHPDRLVFRPQEGQEGAGSPQGRGEDAPGAAWPLDAVTAVQASSASLQINTRDAPLASFRFHDDSVFLWERLVQAALRARYRRAGRGEILEFQPRIATG